MRKLTFALYAVLLPIALASLKDKPCGGSLPRLISCSVKPLSATSGRQLKGAPHIRVREGTSSNWSGYAAVQGSLASPAADAVTAVTGSWTVPKVTGPAGQHSAL